MRNREAALAKEIAAALFNSSSSFRRQLQTPDELAGIADAVVAHLLQHDWQFLKRPEMIAFYPPRPRPKKLIGGSDEPAE